MTGHLGGFSIAFARNSAFQLKLIFNCTGLTRTRFLNFDTVFTFCLGVVIEERTEKVFSCLC